jgi:hypothetical protein
MELRILHYILTANFPPTFQSATHLQEMQQILQFLVCCSHRTLVSETSHKQQTNTASPFYDDSKAHIMQSNCYQLRSATETSELHMKLKSPNRHTL